MRKRTHLKEPASVTGNHTGRRWQRKAAVHRIVSLLVKIRDAGESYPDGIPENPGSCPMAGAAGETVDRLNEAIDALEEAYAM
jgi:hypothetical protein